jgi:hypothetical protein
MLENVHARGHFGAVAMVDAIHEEGKTWPNLRQDCLDVVAKCVSCQRFNIAKRGYHPLRTIHARMPGDHVAIDLAGPFVESNRGNKYLLVVVDVCTRFVFLKAIPDKSAKVVARTLYDLFCLVGFPNILQSDNGSEFKNEVFAHIALKAQVEHRFITPYHPRANGLAERFVGTAKLTISKYLKSDVSDWDEHVPGVQYAINTKVASIHNSTPFSLFFGRRLRNAGEPNIQSALMSEEDLLKRVDYMTQLVFPAISDGVQVRQKALEKRFRAGVKNNPFPDGSYVMVKDPKYVNMLQPKWDGPFKVVRRTQGGSYVLEDLIGELIESDCAPSRMKLAQREPVEDDSNIYEIQQILNHRPVKGRENEMEYLVRWKGYSPEHDSWVPFTNFIETAIIEKYRRRRGINESNERSGKTPESSSSASSVGLGTDNGAKVQPTRRSSRIRGRKHL